VQSIRRCRLHLALMLLALIGASPAIADERAKDVESFMQEYLRLWNAGDSATITSRMVAFDAPHRFATKEGLQSEFDRLKASGYSHSNSLGIDACWINANQALAVLRYSRIATDGTPMPPQDRATLYIVKKLKEGLRISNLIPIDPTARIDCASFTSR
jgi:hypothetical protein